MLRGRSTAPLFKGPSNGAKGDHQPSEHGGKGDTSTRLAVCAPAAAEVLNNTTAHGDISRTLLRGSSDSRDRALFTGTLLPARRTAATSRR